MDDEAENLETGVAALARRRDAGACEALAAVVARTLDAEFDAARAAGVPIACAPGCTFCCHQRVNVFPHEAAALHRRLASLEPSLRAAITRRVLDNAARVDAMSPGEHRAANLPCAFLDGALCSVHDVRPSACAAYHSLSRARCEHAFLHSAELGTPKTSRPALRALQEAGEALVERLAQCLRSAGLATKKGELHQRLRERLTEPGAVI